MAAAEAYASYEIQHPDRLQQADVTEAQNDLMDAWCANDETIVWEAKGDLQDQLEGRCTGCRLLCSSVIYTLHLWLHCQDVCMSPIMALMPLTFLTGLWPTKQG
jgi:hypothetical protein